MAGDASTNRRSLRCGTGKPCVAMKAAVRTSLMCLAILVLLTSAMSYANLIDDSSPVPIVGLLPSAGPRWDRLGWAVDANREIIVGGAPFAQGSIGNEGAVYVFRKDSDGIWRDEAKFGPDLSRAGNFGVSVSIDKLGGGARFVAGADRVRCRDEGPLCGEAYIFELDSGSWVEVARLQSLDLDTEQVFGHAVAMEGSLVAIGAPETSGELGAVHLFEEIDGTWERGQVLVAGEPTGYFGSSLALQGTLLVIGAERDSAFGDSSGAVYVFRRNEQGDWEKEQRITAPNASSGNRFGESVAVCGSTILIGEPRSGLSEPGITYVFDFNGLSGQWEESARLDASDGSGINNEFGIRVALSENTALVGAYFDDDDGGLEGSAYLYRKSDSNWVEDSKLTSLNPDGMFFGSSVAITEDALIVGAREDNTIFLGGAIWVYLRGEVLSGNVDTGSGSCPADVLFVNASSGNSRKLVAVDSGLPSTIAVERAPSGNGIYALWVYDFRKYSGASISYLKSGATYDLGSGVKALPINNSVTPGSVPCPLTFLTGWTSQSLGAGAAGRFCLNASPGFPRAPTSFNVIFPPGNFILGGLVTDQNSINSPALNVSIANWIFVRSR